MVKEDLNFIKQEAEDNGITPQIYLGEPVDVKFYTKEESVKVSLISSSHDYQDFITPMFIALSETWNPDFDLEAYNEAEKLKYVQKGLKEHRLEQYLENFRLVFKIDGIPRYITHQIVRHRRMSFSQESFRVCDIRKHGVRMPDYIKHNNELSSIYKESVLQSIITYSKLVDEGIPPELARSVVPMGVLTSLTMSTDLGSFIAYLNFRGNKDGLVQEEHYYLAEKLREEFIEKEQSLYKLIEPLRNGKW